MTEPARPPGFTDPDATYAALVAAIESTGNAEAPAFLSRLVLLLAAEVRNHERLKELIARAMARG